MDKNIKWGYIYERNGEEKHSIKSDKKYIMILKSYILRLSSTLFSK